MAAYLVFIRDKTLDQRELDVYSKEAPATIVGHDVKPLAFYGPHEDLEGPPIEGMVLFEFPNVDAAKAWYDGDTYRKVREHRFKGATYRVTLIQGV